MASSFKWSMESGKLFQNIGIEKIIAAVHMKADTEAIKLQSYMQTQRPWTDRTGQAKRTLSATTSRSGTGVAITLAHGVDYGQWLETRWHERYSIIKPTLATQTPKVMASFEGLLNRL